MHRSVSERPPARRVILNFHGVGTPQRSLESGEAPYWIDERRFREIVDLIGGGSNSTSSGAIGITFDDGNRSDLEVCAPILARKGLKASFFVLAGRLGQEGSLSEADLRELQDMGFEVGSHGYAHADWRTLDGEAERRELIEARQIISEACGRDIREAAIPFGRYRRRVLSRLRELGYKKAYTSDGGLGTPTAFVVPRTSIRVDTSLEQIESIIRGEEKSLRRLRRGMSMLVKRLV